MTELPDRFRVEPDPIPVGAKIKITFVHEGCLTDEVEIEVDNGREKTLVIIIKMRGGIGSIEWTVPKDWGKLVNFNHPESMEHTVPIVPPV